MQSFCVSQIRHELCLLISAPIFLMSYLFVCFTLSLLILQDASAVASTNQSVIPMASRTRTDAILIVPALALLIVAHAEVS